MIYLPVTRAWSIEPVVAALDASDVPKSVILLLDAPGCEGWGRAFRERGWVTMTTRTGNPEPPADRLERRPRHLAMRRLSQRLTAPYTRVLYVEDDTLVPPDVWTRLSALLDRGYRAASGVQRGRHGQPACGVWRQNGMAMTPFEPEGVVEADAVGHYCLMTSGATYAGYPIVPGPNEPIDCAHTRLMAPIAVDAAVWCGHLLESGEIIV
jgi:hypothetical protein